MEKQMKPAVIYKEWDGQAWQIEARAGKKGTGRIVARASHWDNPKAEEQAWDGFLAQMDRMGYESVA